MFAPPDISDDRACKVTPSAFILQPVLIRTGVTRRGSQVIPQCRHVCYGILYGPFREESLTGFDSPIAFTATLVTVLDFHRATIEAQLE
jgi:hypothetical protein